MPASFSLRRCGGWSRRGGCPCVTRHPLQKITHEPSHVVHSLVEREVPCVQHMHFGLWQVSLQSCYLGDVEYLIVSAPDDQRGRLPFTQPRLPRRISGKVCPIVVEKVRLDIGLAWPGE